MSQQSSSKSPKEFLEEISSSLSKGQGLDTELSAILKQHILLAEPSTTAVADAKAAILELAASRASAGESNAE